MNDAGVKELSQAHVTAELNGDVDALDRLLTDDFRGVGPLGFVVDKQRWLDRYRNGELYSTAIRWTDVETRVYGDAAIAIGRWDQQATHQGNPANGTFRVTQTFVRDGAHWRLGGVQLSPIAAPPSAPAS